ncbi:MAG: peptide chain release factor 2 [Actinobacteria bacterium]|nr:peptide chain release factor 2 [Actinomycetota bacterium]
MLDEQRSKYDDLLKKLIYLGTVFEIDKKLNQLEKLHTQTTVQGFWDDQEKAQRTTQEITGLKDIINSVQGIEGKLEDVETALEMLDGGDDPGLAEELDENLKCSGKDLEELEEKAMLGQEHDSYPAVVTIHPGAGGTESADWAEMLFRMYSRWIEKRKFSFRIIDRQAGDEAGIKNITFTVSGKNAFGLLKSEKGIHRLVRISPFDSSKRRHTSFASVDVIPLIENDIDIKINKEDLRIDTYRSSGAGGQHVNVTDSAVRITHIPSGTIVQCQDERSQLLNRQTAMQILSSKLFELEQKKNREEIEKLQGEKKEIGWGNQIRSYVMMPYQLVKDHRSQVEIGDINSVLDGSIDPFIRGFLEKKLARE